MTPRPKPKIKRRRLWRLFSVILILPVLGGLTFFRQIEPRRIITACLCFLSRRLILSFLTLVFRRLSFMTLVVLLLLSVLPSHWTRVLFLIMMVRRLGRTPSFLLSSGGRNPPKLFTKPLKKDGLSLVISVVMVLMVLKSLKKLVRLLKMNFVIIRMKLKSRLINILLSLTNLRLLKKRIPSWPRFYCLTPSVRRRTVVVVYFAQGRVVPR